MRRNCILTVVGQKGSGKSSFAKYLVGLTPRVIVVDRMIEYDGEVHRDFGAALDFLAQHWHVDFRLVCRFAADVYHRELFRFVFLTAQRCPTRPISVVVEEADFFCTPQGIEPSLEALFKYGRHYRINLLAIARGDTDLHRSVTNNSDAVVVFRQRKFSRDMRERFTQEELREIETLQTFSPSIPKPVSRVHFLTYPPDSDPLTMWSDSQGLAPEGKRPYLEGDPQEPASRTATGGDNSQPGG